MAGSRSVRVRTTVAATAVAGVALLAAAGSLVWATNRALTEDLRDSSQLYAGSLARQLSAGAAPASLVAGDGEELLVQVLDARGAVVAASPALSGRPPLADLRPGESRRVGELTGDDQFLAVAVLTADGGHTVLVARSVDVVDESTRTVAGLTAVGLPVLGLTVGLITWAVVGRALRPVERIRREVDEIGSAQLDRRVEVPPTDDEIARLAVTVNRMLDRLEEGTERLSRFTADAAHELRSPVTAIRAHAELALAHPDRTAVIDLATTVLAEGLRLQRLVEDLLLLARGDEGHLPAPVPVDLDDIVFAEAERLRATSSLRVDTSGVSAGRLIGRPAALRRVLSNLGDNAARHARSLVALSVTTGHGYVVATVDDDGPGIPESERSGVFDRFVRLDEARARDAGGSGLGLSIVAQVVAGHGGTAEITTAPQGGTRVRLRFPAAD